MGKFQRERCTEHLTCRALEFVLDYKEPLFYLSLVGLHASILLLFLFPSLLTFTGAVVLSTLAIIVVRQIGEVSSIEAKAIAVEVAVSAAEVINYLIENKGEPPEGMIINAESD